MNFMIVKMNFMIVKVKDAFCVIFRPFIEIGFFNLIL